MRNDLGYLRDPETSADNRWMHRPFMDWDEVARRTLPGSVEARVFQGVLTILRARTRTPHLHATYPTEIRDVAHERVFVTLRRHPLGPMIGLYNFCEETVTLSTAPLAHVMAPRPFDQLEQRFVDVSGGELTLRAYERLWLV
jgi:amylosucrase